MYTFIINPHSRSGKGLTIWHTVEAQLEQRQICYTAFFTKYQRQATTYVRKLTSDGSSRVLVVLGGDGTLNEVINGICFPERRSTFIYFSVYSTSISTMLWMKCS